MKIYSLTLTAFMALALSGCHFRSEPNPNDPNQVSGDRQPFVIKDYMKQLSDVVSTAVEANQITETQGVELTTEEARTFMHGIRLKRIPPNEEAIVAQGFITAHEWEKAKEHLDVALTVDSTANALVNDRLRYARCLANLGDVEGAIKWARLSFEAPPTSKWPILYGVYLEIVPPAIEENPADGLELAQLVKDAISQHEQAARDLTLKDDEMIANEDRWYDARPYHIEKAWDLVIKIYNDAKRPDLAKAAAASRAAVVKPSNTTQI
jgi:tetratricopeptide (TPR) repeat protein